MLRARANRFVARSVIVLMALGFVQTGLSYQSASAATPNKPTITSITSGATSLTVNMQTTGIDATQWRWSVTKRTGVSCANTYGDGVVQSVGSLSPTISITGLTSGCTYSVKVAGYNGVIGDYAESEKLVGAFANGLNIYTKNETGLSAVSTHLPFTSGTCNTGVVSNISVDYTTNGPTGCNTDGFTSYYVGYIKAPYSGTVNFRAAVDDGLYLNVQGQNVIKYESDLAATNYNASGSISMVANEIYRIELWHHEYNGNASFNLYWDWSGQSTILVPSANFATDPSVFFGTCPLGVAARCSAGSALEIKQATGTNMDGQYWIDIAGTPTLVFCIMNSSEGGGGWMLAMKGKNASSTFGYSSSYWTDTNLLNNTYPQRFSSADSAGTWRNTDAKYEPFTSLKSNQVLVLYPEVSGSTKGGAYGAAGSNNSSGVNSVVYGFAWHETFTAGSVWTAYNSTTKWGGNSYNFAQTGGPSATSTCVNSASTLNYLFNTASRCAFRQVQSNYNSAETPYSAVGNNVFFSQTDIRFFGINYANASNSYITRSRIGFGWNENGGGEESSNDGNGGIGTYSSNSTTFAAGTFNGCCSATNNLNPGQTGMSGGDNTTTQLGFELYLRNSSSATITGNNLRLTVGRSGSMVAGNGYTASGTNGSNTFRISPLVEGLSINSSTGVITASESLGVGTYTETVTVTDTNGVAGIKAVTIQVLADASDTDTALTFTGAATLTTSATFSLSGDQTWEAWVRPGSTCTGAAQRTVFGSENFVLLCISGYWYVSFRDSGGTWRPVQSAREVNVGVWTHIAVTRSGTTATFYVNNAQIMMLVNSAWVSSWTVSSVNSAASAFYIGGFAGGQYYSGDIDELKVWTEARTLAQISDGMHKQISLSSANLLEYWDFNEGSGTSAISRSQIVDSTSNFSPISTQWSTVATTSISGPYTYVVVPRTLISKSGGWTSPDSVTALYILAVGAGGGGGGGYQGGGGGGGAVIETRVAVTPKTVYALKVGMGGRGATNPLPGQNGETTTAFSVTAIGGGAGGIEFNTGSNVQIAATSGASGGGGNWGSYFSGGTGLAGNNGGNSLNLESPNCPASRYAGAGGGGAGSAGSSPTCTTGGTGGNGRQTFYGSSYYGGGGGGSFRTSSSSASQGLSPHAGASSYVDGALPGAVDGAAYGGGNLGGGGGAGLSAGGASGFGADGGSGVIVIRYITALKPSYTAPSNAYLNVGMTETFTTNVAQDSATAVLTRSFRWESSTTGSNGTFSLIKQGTGATNAAYSWVPTDTSTTGSNYVYRVIVTDSDTAGLFIQDTSTAVYATINLALKISGKSSVTKTTLTSKTETFTVTQGTPTYSYALTPTSPYFWLDTATAGSPRLKFADTVTVGVYYETITVTDSVTASLSYPITITVNTPPSFTASSSLVDTGTVFYIDPGNTASYSGTGNLVNDMSGRALSANLTANLSGKLSGAVTTTCVAPGYSKDGGGSLTFASTSKQCAYAASVGNYSSYTYEVWVKRNGNQVGVPNVVTTPYASGGKQLIVSLGWYNGTDLKPGVWNGTDWFYAPQFTIPNNTWSHVTVTFSGSVLTAYLNGSYASTLTGIAITWDSSKQDGGLVFGRRWDSDEYFDGSIGYFRMYDRVLTTQEISQDYNATSGRFAGTQNENQQNRKYGQRTIDTYTVTAGSETITSVLSGSGTTKITWDTSTARNILLSIQESLTPGTYYDTITATDANGSVTRLPITFTIAKADTITVSMDTGTVTTYNTKPITSYPKPTIKGLVNLETATVTTKFSSGSYALSASPPTNADTYTVTGADITFMTGSLTYYQGVIYETSTAVINKANQTPLNISMYGAVIGSPFTITLLGGSGTGAVTETLTGVSTAPGCAISNHVLTSSATQISYCQLQVTKAADTNYLIESSTVQIYFMQFGVNMPTNQVGSGSTIALNGITSFFIDASSAPLFTSLGSDSATVGTVILINGAGFYFADPSKVSIKFWRNVGAITYTLVSDSQISVTVPVGATTGRIVITTPNGIAATSTFTVLP